MASGGWAVWDCDCDDALDDTVCDGVVVKLLPSGDWVDNTVCGSVESKLTASGGGAARDSAGEGALDNAVIDVGGSVGWFEGGSIGVRPAVVVDSESNGGSVTSNLARRSSTMA